MERVRRATTAVDPRDHGGGRTVRLRRASVALGPWAALFLLLAGCDGSIRGFTGPGDGGEDGGDGGDVTWSAVAAGPGFTCGLDRSGRARCWGADSLGTLGDGSVGGVRSHPLPVAGTLRFTELVAGAGHACGLTEAGEAWCWGDNRFGQLGVSGGSALCRHADGTFPCRPTPARAARPLRFQALTAGGGHTCGLTEETALYCWGSNRAGQLGIGTFGGATSTPHRVGSGVRLVAAGGVHTCAVTALRDVLCWGGNVRGQLGDGSRLPASGPRFVTIRGAEDVAAGPVQTCVRAPATCWGGNELGQLGIGRVGDTSLPRRVDTSLDLASLSLGARHGCGRSGEDVPLCWGSAEGGALGDGRVEGTASSPVRVAGEHRFIDVAAGDGHACGVDRGGGAWCWGENRRGQLGDGTRSSRPRPVAVR